MSKKLLFRVLSLVLSLVLLAGCQPGSTNTQPSTSKTPEPKEVTYTVTVATAVGRVLNGVEFKIRSNSDGYIKATGKLSSDGKITFKGMDNDTFAVTLDGLPEGYIPSTLTVDKPEMNIVLETAPLTGKTLGDKTFRLGDVMYDFSITDTDGQTYTLSELLKTKKAVVLNFWYINCPFCIKEFPMLQSAYEAYSDDVALIAVNPAIDTEQEICDFKASKDYRFPMAYGDETWMNAMNLGVTGCPRTVIIDRYGVVSAFGGTVEEYGVFDAAFEYITSDSYKQEFQDSMYGYLEKE